MENPHEEKQAVYLERIIKNAVSPLWHLLAVRLTGPDVRTSALKPSESSTPALK